MRAKEVLRKSVSLSGAVSMKISGEDLQKIMRGEQPPELIARIEAMKAEQESA